MDSVIMVIVICFYFLPTLIAMVMDRRQAAAIVALNLIAGWTVIGWMIALIWSLIQDSVPEKA